MSLLDGLKLEMKNPLAENNDEMDFVMESAFDIALEKETDKKLSEDDIEAILRGDDDIDPEEDDSSAALESALEALDNILSSSDVTDKSFATDLTSSDEEDDLDGGAEPAEEGWIEKHYERKLEAAKITVMADKLSRMDPIGVARKVVSAIKPILDTSPEGSKHVADVIREYQQDDPSKSSNYFVKTINSASIGIVLGASKDDPDTKILIMMHIPVIGTGKFNKGKSVEALLNTTGMAKYILKPIQPAEVKKVDDDAAATEAAIIAECEAALEVLNDSDIDRAGNVTNIKAVEGNEDPDVSEEDDEDDDMSLESLLDKCMKL